MPLCWQCGKETGGELFCPSCRSLQAPDPEYFRFFGLEERLGVDTADLQKRFYALSRRLHPDLYTRKSEREQEYSLEATAILNDAYRVLREPVDRAEYVLKRNGFDIGEQRGNNVPPELLEEMFELNMALEEMRGGDESVRPQLEQARAKFTAMLGDIRGELESLFAESDARTEPRAPAGGPLARIRAVLNRRRYILNLVREVEKELSQHNNVHVSN
jgi:molecular chaperone HscB